MSAAITSARANWAERTKRVLVDHRRIGEIRVEPVDDRQTLHQRMPVDLERRHEALCITRAVRSAALAPVEQITATRS